MDTNAKLYQDMTKILVKREDIQKAVAQLGREIRRPVSLHAANPIRAAIW